MVKSGPQAFGGSSRIYHLTNHRQPRLWACQNRGIKVSPSLHFRLQKAGGSRRASFLGVPELWETAARIAHLVLSAADCLPERFALSLSVFVLNVDPHLFSITNIPNKYNIKHFPEKKKSAYLACLLSLLVRLLKHPGVASVSSSFFALFSNLRHAWHPKVKQEPQVRALVHELRNRLHRFEARSSLAEASPSSWGGCCCDGGRLKFHAFFTLVLNRGNFFF